MEIQGRPSNVNRHGIWKFRAVLVMSTGMVYGNSGPSSHQHAWYMGIQGRPSNVNRHGIWKFRAVLLTSTGMVYGNSGPSF